MKMDTKNIIKLFIGGLCIFVLGFYFGNVLDMSSFSSIEGYMYNGLNNATTSDATSSNATSSDATSGNATSSNATSSDATSANATSANATSGDIGYTRLYLLSLKLLNNSAIAGQKVYLSFISNYNHFVSGRVTFEDKYGVEFSTDIESINGTPYVVIPNNVLSSKYSISSISLSVKVADGTTHAATFFSNGSKFENNSIDITNPKTDLEVRLNDLSFKNDSVKIGEKAYLNYKTDKTINYMRLTFANENMTFNIYAKDLKSNPYIVIPSTIKSGTYKLSAVLMSNSTSTAFLTGSSLKFDINLTIQDNETPTYIYYNETLNGDILNKIKNDESITDFTIIADNSSYINEDVFETFKGTNKKIILTYLDNEMIFNGNDITQPKDIDVRIDIYDTYRFTDIYDLVEKGVVVDFPNNGTLPGNALIKVSIPEDLNYQLNDNFYVYLYNEDKDKFYEISLDGKKDSDGYYEFNINHNSSYVLVNEKLNPKLIMANKVTFQKSKKTLIVLILSGVLVIGIAVGVILYVKKKKNKGTDDTQRIVEPEVPETTNEFPWDKEQK